LASASESAIALIYWLANINRFTVGTLNGCRGPAFRVKPGMTTARWQVTEKSSLAHL
jgi:hypothetical protein